MELLAASIRTCPQKRKKRQQSCPAPSTHSEQIGVYINPLHPTCFRLILVFLRSSFYPHPLVWQFINSLLFSRQMSPDTCPARKSNACCCHLDELHLISSLFLSKTLLKIYLLSFAHTSPFSSLRYYPPNYIISSYNKCSAYRNDALQNYLVFALTFGLLSLHRIDKGG